VGVFAKEQLESRELIEACPVILFHKDTLDDMCEDEWGFSGAPPSRHILMDYPFHWENAQLAFALGWGGVYNHSTDHPNAHWQCNFDNPTLDFYTKRVIKPGEEIFIRYMPYDICDDLWFLDLDADDESSAYKRRQQPRISDWKDLTRTVKSL
jgi:hypothetical protein